MCLASAGDPLTIDELVTLPHHARYPSSDFQLSTQDSLKIYVLRVAGRSFKLSLRVRVCMLALCCVCAKKSNARLGAHNKSCHNPANIREAGREREREREGCQDTPSTMSNVKAAAQKQLPTSRRRRDGFACSPRLASLSVSFYIFSFYCLHMRINYYTKTRYDKYNTITLI